MMTAAASKATPARMPAAAAFSIAWFARAKTCALTPPAVTTMARASQTAALTRAGLAGQVKSGPCAARGPPRRLQ
jgi:hypothetical protein